MRADQNVTELLAVTIRLTGSDTENAVPAVTGNGAALYDTFRSVSRLDYRTLLRLNAIALGRVDGWWQS